MVTLTKKDIEDIGKLMDELKEVVDRNLLSDYYVNNDRAGKIIVFAMVCLITLCAKTLDTDLGTVIEILKRVWKSRKLDKKTVN
jgi:hypothetical protein